MVLHTAGVRQWSFWCGSEHDTVDVSCRSCHHLTRRSHRDRRMKMLWCAVVDGDSDGREALLNVDMIDCDRVTR